MAAVLGVCAAMHPSPTGKGTHEVLGLPKCLICRVTGHERCPSCGMTTAFCHILRGQFSQAQRCNAAAIPVFGLWVAIMLYCAAIAILGKQWLWQEVTVWAVLVLLLLGCWIAAFL